jgi:hypothetical protein
MGRPFLEAEKMKGIQNPCFNNNITLIIKIQLDYQVGLMMNKPTDHFVMASRDAVKSHVHPRNLLNATSYSLF